VGSDDSSGVVLDPGWEPGSRKVLPDTHRGTAAVQDLTSVQCTRSSATFAQFNMAMALGKQIIVYDPDKLTRSNRDRQDNPVHRAFNHLMGAAMVHSPAVLWLTDRTEALEAIASHATFSVKVGPDAAAAAS